MIPNELRNITLFDIPILFEEVKRLSREVEELKSLNTIQKKKYVFTLKEVSETVNQSKNSLIKAIYEGRLIASGGGVKGSNFRISKFDLDAFIENQDSFKLSIGKLKKAM
jgi:hypothetical protein